MSTYTPSSFFAGSRSAVAFLATLLLVSDGTLLPAQVIGTPGPSSAVPASAWTYAKSIPLQGFTPLFLAVTPEGHIAVAPFNTGRGADAAGNADIPVIVVANPLTANPTLHQVCNNRFPAKRGYSGIAVDGEGSYFVSADTGDGNTSWIRKFRSNGQPDEAFGKKGELATGVRYLGLAVHGKHLISTASFAKLRVYDSQTGREISAATIFNEPPSVRDICIDPTTQNVYGVAQAAIWVWEAGTLDAAARFRFRRLSTDMGPSIAGEGIFFDPLAAKAAIPLQKQSALMSVGADGKPEESKVPTKGQGAIVDGVVLPNGSALFLSDSRQNQIHVFRR